MQRVGSQFTEFLKSGSLLSVIFIVNVGVWVLSLLFPIVDYLYALPNGSAAGMWNEWLALSSDWGQVLRRPWTLGTYMFLHAGFWHLLFNMVMLYFAGTLCYRYLGSRRFGWVYFMGGIAGALLYLLIYNAFPVGRMYNATLVGASAAVLSVFVAVAAYAPNQEVGIWLIRTVTVKMKWLALAFVLLDMVSIPSSNAGGHIAHLGGALFGYLYIVAMRRLAQGAGQHQSRPRIRIHKKRDSQTSQRPSSRPMSDEEYNRRKVMEQKRIDAILDKISKSGYENLTREEKEILFKYKG